MHTTSITRQSKYFDSAYQKHVIEHNAQHWMNCYILKCMLYIVCMKFYSAFELALRGHCKSEESGNEEYLENYLIILQNVMWHCFSHLI